MKKLIIIAVLFFFGCQDSEEKLDNCVLRVFTFINTQPFVGYKCYEEVYTKKECMDKQVDDYDYYDYITESCSDFCADDNGTVCREY